MTAKQEIEVYTDGSVTHTTPPYLGAGWVVRAQGEILSAGSARLENILTPENQNWRIDIAEVSAAILSLQTLEIGSQIRLYTDCRKIQRFHQEPEYRGFVLNETGIAPFYQRLRAQFNKHSILSVELRHDHYDPYLEMAHKLARDASRGQVYGEANLIEHHVETWPPQLKPDSFDI